MDISVSKHSLTEAIATVSAAASTRDMGEILGAVQLEADFGNQRLHVRVVGGSMAMATTIDATVISDGKCLVPATVLSSFVRAAAGPDLEIQRLGGDLIFKGPKGDTKCRVLTEEAYPFPPVDKSVVDIGPVIGQRMVDAISRTHKCMDGATSLYQGMRLRAHDGVVTLVGGNGNRLCFCLLGDSPAEFNGIIPQKAAGVISRLASKVDEIELSGDENRIGVKAGDYVLRCIQMAGDYPEVEKIIVPISQGVTTSVVVDGPEMLAAMERVKALAKLSARELLPIVELQAAERTLSISCRTSVGEVSETLDAQVEGDLIAAVSFNWAFINDGVDMFPVGNIRLTFVGGKANLLYLADGEWQYLAMPLNIPQRNA